VIPGSASAQFFGAAGSAGAGGGYEIERSLRFNSSDSAYLSHAGIAGNGTWTWAGWVTKAFNRTSRPGRGGQLRPTPLRLHRPQWLQGTCTTNLPEPTIADGSTAMDVALYTGNGSTQTISGLNFSPDFILKKSS
jgi:hypothetical protein